jgi:hypothetical protein
MFAKQIGLSVALLSAASFGSVTTASAQTPMAGEMMRGDPASPVLMQKRQAVEGVSADAMAVLSALQRDPTLARQLASNPEGGQALLRERGATRAEKIIVTSTGGEAAREITITIIIDHITIIIKL